MKTKLFTLALVCMSIGAIASMLLHPAHAVTTVPKGSPIIIVYSGASGVQTLRGTFTSIVVNGGTYSIQVSQ